MNPQDRCPDCNAEVDEPHAPGCLTWHQHRNPKPGVPLGFVVLAKRPNDCPVCVRGDQECPDHGEAPYPRKEKYSYEPVSAVFSEYPSGLEQAQNALEHCTTHRGGLINFVIGEITERTP